MLHCVHLIYIIYVSFISLGFIHSIVLNQAGYLFKRGVGSVKYDVLCSSS